MKVLDLACGQEHRFEGWFGSEDDFRSQLERKLIECPFCGDRNIVRRLSAPRLNLSGAKEPKPASTSLPQGAPPAGAPLAHGAQASGGHGASGQEPTPSDEARAAVMREVQSRLMEVVKEVVANTEDVGTRFAEEARRIHYGEADPRAIRGKASPEEARSLHEEGIEVMALPIPAALDGPVH